MAAVILIPLADDFVNLIDTFSKAAAVLPSPRQKLEISQLYDLRRSLYHSLENPNCKQSLSFGTENQTRVGLIRNGEASEQPPEAAKVCLEGIAAEVRTLRDALIEAVKGMNALISSYIINSFDEPLLQLLTPNQCAQLLEAISLADVVSELDKQVQVLKRTAEEHEQEHDLHLELVKDIKTDFLDALERIRKLATQQSKFQIRSQELIPGERSNCGDLLGLEVYIQNMYAGLQTQPDATQHLVAEQERTVIALKLFLEDKLSKIEERRCLRSGGNPGVWSRGFTDWPSATIPTAQLSTVLLSSMVANSTSSSKLNCSDATQPPMLETDSPLATTQLQPATLSEVPALIDLCDYPGEAIVAAAPNLETFESCHKPRPPIHDPVPETGSHVVPHVKFNLPKHLDKRRDSAISLMSSTGKPERIEIHEDETLPDSGRLECGEDGNSEQDNGEQPEDGITMAAATEKTKDGTIEEIADGRIMGSERLEQEDETAVGDEMQMSPTVGDPSMPNPNTSEDLYSADDQFAPTRPDRSSATDETGSALVLDACSHQNSLRQSPGAPTTPFLSTHWPQRAWLQTILSMLTPNLEAQSTTPLSPSFPSESLASPPPNPSSSEWYSGYDAWWSFAMRDSRQRDEHEDSESTTTSTSEQSWGAGSRSTETDSIDS